MEFFIRVVYIIVRSTLVYFSLLFVITSITILTKSLKQKLLKILKKER